MYIVYFKTQYAQAVLIGNQIINILVTFTKNRNT